MPACPNCGSENAAGEEYCSECGLPLDPDTGAPTPEEHEAETEGAGTLPAPHELTPGNILAYIVGAVTIFFGFEQARISPVAGALLALLGLFVLPPNRRRLEMKLGVRFGPAGFVVSYLLVAGVSQAIFFLTT